VPSEQEPKAPARSAAALIQEVRDRYKVASEAEAELRRNQLADKRFAAGEHWSAEMRSEREGDNRPCLTIDRLTPQIKQVTNQQRQMRPSIQIGPVDGQADIETAEVLQGLVGHIERSSDADDAYDQAGNDQTIMGRGFIGIETAYIDDEGFDQEIRIVRKRRPESIYFDPSVEKRDYSDAMYALECFDLSRETYKARFPRSKVALASLTELRTLGDEAPGWITEEVIRVVKYWHIELEASEIAGPNGRKRTIEKRTVKCDLVNGAEVLESYDWPGKYIPLVPVIGEEIVLEGKTDYRGMVRRAKDPQRMSNYWKTGATEMVALAKTAPWLIAEGQLEGYEHFWEQANRRNLPYLPYKFVTLGGVSAPPPVRNVAEPPIQALTLMTQASENDLRAATGFYDVGERESREQSGRAIMARQKQGELGNSDFLDGLARAIRHVGRIVIDLAPHIYDVPRVMRILGTDNQPREVLIHAGNDEAAQAKLAELQAAEAGKIERAFDLSAGKYDVTVAAGPNQGTARQEFAEAMGQIFQGNPGLFQIVGDLYFENLDIPNAKQIAQRLKKTLPPNLQDQPDQKDIPPAVQGQMAQMAQQIEQMGAALQEAQQAVEGKQLELESKERIAAAELASKVQIAEIQAEVARQKAMLDSQLAQMKLDAENARIAFQAERAEQSQGREQAHAAQMADRAAVERAIEQQQQQGAE
jgi:hypothetical protein